MIKYRDKAKITIGEIIFLIATIALFIGHFINSTIFHNYYLFANFGLAFCYLFMAQFVLNPEGELDYKIPIIAGIGMFSILLSIPRWLRLYSSDLWFVMFMSFLLFRVPLLYYLISKKGILRDFYLELILIRFGIILVVSGLLFFAPGNIPPIKQLKLTYINQNEFWVESYYLSEANHIFEKSFNNNSFSSANLWIDSVRNLKVKQIANSRYLKFEYVQGQLDSFEAAVEQSGAPGSQDLSQLKDEFYNLFDWQEFRNFYYSICNTTGSYGYFLREDKNNNKSIEMLNRSKTYFKIIFLMEEWDSAILFHINRHLFNNYLDLAEAAKVAEFFEKSISEFHRIGWLQPYWKAKIIYDKAGFLYHHNQEDTAVELLKEIIVYLESEDLDSRADSLLHEVEIRFNFLSEPTDSRTL